MSATPGDPSPQWLTAEEREAWLALIGVVHRLPSALNAQMRRDSGLTMFEYRLLSALSEAEERTLTPSFLVEYLRCEHPQLSQVVNRLVTRGLVTKDLDSTDKRRRLVTLTNSGMEAVVAAAPGHVAEVRALAIDAVGPELQGPLREACLRILGALGVQGAENLRRGLAS